MADKQLSTDYNNLVRDLSDVFELVLQRIPVIGSLIGQAGIGGRVATNTKYEWLEDVSAQREFVVDTIRPLAGVTLSVTNITGLKLGTVLGLKSAAGQPRSVQLVVTAINVGLNDATVAIFGGTTDVQIEVNDVAFIVAIPKEEKSLADPAAGFEPTVEFNHTQIFDRTACVSGTAQSSAMYGINPLANGQTIEYQVQKQMIDMAYEINNSVIYGVRTQRVGTGIGQRGSMGGILDHLNRGAGNKVNGAAANVSPTLINNAYELATGNGADGLDWIICNTNQARKISAFNQLNTRLQRQDTQTGQYVLEFVSDLPVEGGLISKILVDRNWPKDQIAIVDSSKINLVPMINRGMIEMDATTPGEDGIKRRLLSEWTLEMKNKSESHVLLQNLAL